jgi:putative transposase
MIQHYDIENQYHYLTFSCFQRRWLFQSEEIYGMFITALDNARQSLGFKLTAFVIMPNHVHLLLKPATETTVSEILKAIKRPFSFRLQKLASEKMPDLYREASIVKGNAVVWRFWQVGGGYDRNIFSQSELEEKVNYMHNNPVRMNLVVDAVDWKWSSARFWILNEPIPLRIDVPEIF